MAAGTTARAAWSDRATYRLGERFHGWADMVGRLSPTRFVAVLVGLHLALALGMTWVASRLPFDRLASSDVPLFDERAGALLRGDLIAQGASVAPDTPPLVNFLFLVPHALGGGLLVYAWYFSLWILAVGLALYLGLRRRDEGMARGASLLVVAHPLAWGTASLMVQDEAIVAALVGFAVVALLRAAHGTAGAWTGLGTLVKAWPVVGAPVLLLAARGRARWRVVVGGASAVVLPLLPFLLLAPRYLWHVVGFYGSGVRPDRTTPSGISFWKFLDVLTGAVHEPVMVALLAVASVVLWVLAARGRLAAETAYPLSFVLLFLLYPKIHFGYYLILLVVLAPWLARRPWAATTTFVLAGAAAFAHVSWYGLLPVPWARDPGPPLAAAGLGLLLVAGLGLALVRPHGGWPRVASALRSKRTPPPAAAPGPPRSPLAGGFGASLLGIAVALAAVSVVAWALPVAP